MHAAKAVSQQGYATSNLAAAGIIRLQLYTGQITRTPDHNLVIGDRMSMAHSLEDRAPLVDYKIVEFAARLPTHLMLRRDGLKYILRKTSERYLPPEITKRRKQGFGFPLGVWMSTELADLLRYLLSESRFAAIGVSKQSQIDILVCEHLSRKRDPNYRLWILLNLEMIHRMYLENQSIDDVTELLQIHLKKSHS